VEAYLSLISGLVGAVIGAAASITTIFVQSKLQAKRERTKEALALALEDWKTRLAIAKDQGGTALPLSVFVHYHSKLVQHAEEGTLTPQAIRALSAEQDELLSTLREVQEESRRKRREVQSG
jgi:hypothetical protein